MSEFVIVKRICMGDYKRWLRNSKLIIVPVLLILIKKLIAEPLTEAAVETGNNISVFEPFLSLTNSGMILLLMPLTFMVLMSDCPQQAGIDCYLQMRTTKRKYIIAQILFDMLAVLSFELIMFIATTLMVIGHSDFKMKFSKAIIYYQAYFPDRRFSMIGELMPKNLYNSLTMPRALLITGLQLFAYMMILVLVILLAVIAGKRFAGIIADIVIMLAGAVTCISGIKLQWMFPMSHTIPWIHYQEYYRKEIFPMWGSVLYMYGLMVFLIVLCICLAKKYEIKQG